MELINQFIEDYKKKLNYYDMAARLGAKLLEESLRSSGIRAMVTSRAKSPARLKTKVEQRNRKQEKPYQSILEIYEDIADLSGIRVSLYFPGDRDKADRVINTLFAVERNPKFSQRIQTSHLQQTFFRVLGQPLPSSDAGRAPGCKTEKIHPGPFGNPGRVCLDARLVRSGT